MIILNGDIFKLLILFFSLLQNYLFFLTTVIYGYILRLGYTVGSWPHSFYVLMYGAALSKY